MIVSRLSFDGFRNLQTGVIEPVHGVNILYGSNAQGKTNLLESLWLFTGSRSFRGAKDSEMVGFNADKAKLHLNFTAFEREQEADIDIQARRTVRLNGIAKPSASKLAGEFCAVVFSPVHLSLIKDGPEGRRKFLDAAYCQVKPGYVAVLSDYQRTLSQRNALLKCMRTQSGLEPQLSLWNQRLATSGAQVFAARTAYIRKLSGIAAAIYDGLSRGRETLTIAYTSPAGYDQLSPKDMAQVLYEQLEQAVSADIAVGFTTIGPHRDDLLVNIGDRSAKIYGSQGQQRSAVIALKLAEASVLRDVTGEQPIALLDDVMSELDVFRQDYILNHIHGWQVFLTCCDPATVPRLSEGKAYYIENGTVSEAFVPVQKP